MKLRKAASLASGILLFLSMVGMPTLFNIFHPGPAFALCNPCYCGPAGDIPRCPCDQLYNPGACSDCVLSPTPITAPPTSTPLDTPTPVPPTPGPTPTKTPTIPCVADSGGYRPVCGFGPSPGYPVKCLKAWADCVKVPGADLAACADQRCRCNNAGLEAYCPIANTPVPTSTPPPPTPTSTRTPTDSVRCGKCGDTFTTASSAATTGLATAIQEVIKRCPVLCVYEPDCTASCIALNTGRAIAAYSATMALLGIQLNQCVTKYCH